MEICPLLCPVLPHTLQLTEGSCSKMPLLNQEVTSNCSISNPSLICMWSL